MSRSEPGPVKLLAGCLIRVTAAVTLALSCLSVLVVPDTAAARQTEQALIRFVHVSPDAPPIDIYVDGEIVVKGVEFPTATAFLSFAAGDHRFQMTPAESTVEGALIDIDQDLDADTSYEIAAIGLLNDVEGQVFEVDTSVIESADGARIRLIQGAPSLAGVDVDVEDGDALFEDLDFPSASDYLEMTPATINLLLYATGERQILARLDDLLVEAGWVYDVFVAGQTENETLQFLALKAPAVASCSLVLGGGASDDGCTRFVHGSPDGPPLQVYVDDASEPTSAGLEFGQATGYVGLPEGTHRVRLVAEGGSIEEPLLDAEFDVSAREAAEVVAVNTREAMEIRTFGASLAPLPEGQARLRVIHAVPDADPFDVVMPDGSMLFEAVEFGTASPYAAIPGGKVSVEVRVAGENESLVPLRELTVEAGSVYDIIVVGSVERATVSFSVLDSPSVSAEEHEGIQPAGGDVAPPVASPEIVATSTPTPQA